MVSLRTTHKIESTFKVLPLSVAKDMNFLYNEGDHSGVFKIIAVLNEYNATTSDCASSIFTNSSIYFVHADNETKFRFDQRANGYIVYFTHDFINNISLIYDLQLKLENQNAAVVLTDAERQEVAYLLQKIVDEYNSGGLLHIEVIKCYLKVMITYLSRSMKMREVAAMPNRQRELVKQFTFLLENKFLQLKKVKEYASAMHVTTNYLNTSVKSITGMTVSKHIKMRLIAEAKQMIKDKACSLKEIAYYLGFDDTAQFSKLFKKVVGKDFTTYKRQYLTEIV